MRTLGPPQKEIAFGSFHGPLPRIGWGGAGTTRALRGKKWIYVGIACEDAWISLVVLRTGYAANILAYVFDRKTKTMTVDKTVVAPTFTAFIGDNPHASGVIGRYAFGGSHIAFERSGCDLEVRARFGGIELDAMLDESAAPPGIAAMADFGGGLRNATEKRALASVRGRFVAAGREYALDGAIGGWDYTNGLLPRHTKWRWAFGLAPGLGFNLVEGFVGAAECAAFIGGNGPSSAVGRRLPSGVYPLAEARFTFDKDRPEKPWTIQGDGYDLRFEVGAVHQQHTNLLLVRSHFLQPVGHFFGTMRVGDEERTLDGVPGVVEDQDVVW